MVAKALSKPKKVKRSAFYKLRHQVGLDRAAAADLCGVTERTISNWDVLGAPIIAMKLLHRYDRQDLSGIDGWKGWRFSRGALVKGKMRFLPHTLENLPYVFDVFNRFEAARIRYQQDGISLDDAASIMLGTGDHLLLTGETQGAGVSVSDNARALSETEQ